ASACDKKALTVREPLDILFADSSVRPVKNGGGRSFDGCPFEFVHGHNRTLFSGAHIVEPELAAFLQDQSLSIRRPYGAPESRPGRIYNRVHSHWLLRGFDIPGTKDGEN